MNKKIRIAIVGCGRISKSHIFAINKNKDLIELVSVCDNNQKTLEQFSTNKDITKYLNLETMLINEKLDIVSLCSPSGLHPQQAIQVASQKIDVITEKPMATNFNDAIEMINTCKKFNTKLFVVKQNRFNPTIRILKQAIDENRFGKINLVNVNVFWNRPQEYYDQSTWRGTWKYDGGAFMNQASHYFDLIEWLVGPVESINAFVSTTRNIEVEDTGVVNIKWKNGALGSISVTMLTYPNNFEGSLTILGEKGTVRIGGVAANKIEHWQFEDKKDYDTRIHKFSYDTNSVYGYGHDLFYKNVINTLNGNSIASIDGEAGLKSLEIIIAAYNSAKNGNIVKLPLV